MRGKKKGTGQAVPEAKMGLTIREISLAPGSGSVKGVLCGNW